MRQKAGQTMAGGRRSTASRTARLPAPPSGTNNMVASRGKEEDQEVQIQYPQAVPIPDIPHDSAVTFEVIMFFYIGAALGLQYLNLYRYVVYIYIYTRDSDSNGI